ncbi:MAG: TraU family protein, partial [Novosphingobium sp.]|nr:TraU family protein [Novosphingobium sp.]
MMRLPRFIVALFAALALVVLGAAPARASVTCHGKFVNPITDVCWSCLFPLSIGGLAIWKGSRPDPKNPSFPLCACGSPIPRIGISVGFWEPVRLVDVTNKAWCFPNLGGI